MKTNEKLTENWPEYGSITPYLSLCVSACMCGVVCMCVCVDIYVHICAYMYIYTRTLLDFPCLENLAIDLYRF